MHKELSSSSSSIVFIAGCGRSGTTYLRTLLDAHPDIFIPSESLFLIDYLKYAQSVPKRLLSWLFFSEPQLNAWYRGQPFEIKDIRHAVSHIHESEAHRTGAGIWGQKTPRFVRHMPLFNAFFPNIKWILVYRDPRAVAASMLQSKRHTYVVSSACRRWIMDNRPIIKTLTSHKSPTNIYTVKYEDFIGNIEISIAKIFDFLDVPPMTTDDLSNSIRLPELKGTRFTPNAIRNGVTPQTDRINAWMQVLSRQEIQYIEKKCAWQMGFLGYTPLHVTDSAQAVSGDYTFCNWVKHISLITEYLRKWPRYLFHVVLRKTLLIACHLIKQLSG